MHEPRSAAWTSSVGKALPDSTEIGFGHDPHQVVELDLRPPTELASRLRRVPDQEVHFGRSEEFLRLPKDHAALVHPDHALRLRSSVLRRTRTLHVPADWHAGRIEGELRELSHGMRLAGADDVVARPFLLQHEVHRAHVVGRVAPVAPALHVAELDLVLQSMLDAGGAERDLACD